MSKQIFDKYYNSLFNKLYEWLFFRLIKQLLSDVELCSSMNEHDICSAKKNIKRKMKNIFLKSTAVVSFA